ncbi:MAG: hypothetical protein K9H49_16595 [Bacteroidales bacterium]|nr:hypothetical protein [Bacteroidales bacterium]
MIIAHRGESTLAPENSLSAINLAWEKGAEAVEIDIHLTSDRKIIVIHDPDTKRIGNFNLAISKSTLNELKTVDISKKDTTNLKSEKIPTLEEVIHTIPKNRKLIIEIKCGEEIILPLKKILKSSGLEKSQFEIICFDIKILGAAKKVMPEFRMLWLLNMDYFWPSFFLRKNYTHLIKKINDKNLEGVNAWAGKALNQRFVEEFKKEGLLVYSWTVNDLFKAKELLSYGVDAITTDRASWLNQQLSENIK